MINNFSGKYEFLSNFYFYDTNKCLEVFFQASKAAYTEDYEWILSCLKEFNHYKAPREAKKRGHQIHLRKDWDKINPLTNRLVKVDIMKDLLIKKFDSLVMRQMLLDTGDQIIKESNWWHDDVWGECDGSRAEHVRKCRGVVHPVGQNLLGILLMEVRTLKKNEVLL